jgi:hypothetical protein
MGTVHGVYLKYVGLSALSYLGYTFLTRDENGDKTSILDMLGVTSLRGGGAFMTTAVAVATRPSIFRSLAALILGYSTVVNGAIAVLFKLEIGMKMIGKDPKTGQIPLWSRIIFFPFHIPTRIYTHFHTRLHQKKVPVASEVQPGWWVGGCYGHEIDKTWAGVIDLTVEFPESTIHRTVHYMSIPTWDGVPASPEQIEKGATFALDAKKEGGDILVHCAHGRGRSTTLMCACLVKAGLFETWQEALEHGIQPKRPVCKLNRRMRQVLTQWQARFVDSHIAKKAQ